jgi:polysaccharide export outer membrane protein
MGAAPALGLCLALAPASGLAQQAPEPTIRPGDVVRLQVWREPDWGGEFLVDQFGVVALPLLGDVQVEGETQRSLKERIRQAFAKEVHDPSIQLVVLKRIRVMGEVRTPGVFTLDPTMSVADALAIAGGRGPQGRADQVVLRRAGETIRTDVLVDNMLADLSIQTGDELIVPERSWVSRNSSAVLGSMVGFLGVFVALLVR